MTGEEVAKQLNDQERSTSSSSSPSTSSAAISSSSPVSGAALSSEVELQQQQQQPPSPPPLPSTSDAARPISPFSSQSTISDNPPHAILSNSGGGNKHHSHHQRSRSVNLSPIISGGPFAAPPSMGNFSWDNAAAASQKKRATSPLLNAPNSSVPRSSAMSRPVSHPGLNSSEGRGDTGSHMNTSATTNSGSAFSSTSLSEPLEHKSPELRRLSLSPLDQRQSMQSAPGRDVVSKRSPSPARTFGIPLSPRLQAFGSNRTRRPSSSGAGSGKTGNMTSPLRPSSPVPFPSSPRGTNSRPTPVNPDPEHPFDSVWPMEIMPPSSSSSPRGRELASTWGSTAGFGLSAHRNDRARSPGPLVIGSSSGGRGSPFDKTARASSSPFSGSPTQLRGAHINGSRSDHRRSISGGSSSQDSSPSSSWSPPSTTGLFAQGLPGQPTGTAEPTRSALIALSCPDALGGVNGGTSELSPIFKVISPSKSTSQVDAQVAHGQVTPTNEGPSDEGQGILNQGQRAAILQQAPGPNEFTDGLPPILRASSPFLPRPRTPKEGSSPSSPASFAAASVSPPKTRSFIGMPPRSGYDLSDDPDDVGSEDGASISSREGSASNADDDDDRDIEDTDGDMDGHREDRREEEEGESEAFSADDEDAASSERRRSDSGGSAGGEGGGNDPEGESSVPAFPARPVLPAKRPSLARSNAVPTPPGESVSSLPGGGMLRYFQNPPAKGDAMPWEGSSEQGPLLQTQIVPDNMGDIAADELDMEGIKPDGNDVLLDGLNLSGQSHTAGLLPEGAPAPDQPNAEAAAAAISAEMEQTEESLSTLERIFLFAKSEMTYHRVIVSRSLPIWIREVELSEAVEYVVPLLNGLATDEADVCLAFAAEVHHVIWYFYRNCPLMELESQQDDPQQAEGADEPSNSNETATRPRVYVGIFTALLCALLLNQNSAIASTAQASVVSFFQMLHRRGTEAGDAGETSMEDIVVAHAEGRDGEPVAYEEYHFDQKAKEAVIGELLEHVALAMGKATHPNDEQQHVSEASHSAIVNGEPAHTQASSDSESVTQDTKESSTKATPVEINAGGDVDGDSSWDAEMHDDSQNVADWRKGGSPFDSSSPMFSAYDQADVDEEAAVGRMASVSLLGALSAEEAISAETVRTRFLDEVVNFKDDPTFYVRKEAAVALGPLSRYLSEADLEHRLLPAFDTFCEDKIWHVRQAACATLPAIFQKVAGELRRRRVVAHLRSFVNDVSRNVRMVALEIIGETIYLFDGDEAGVPEELIRFFLGEPFDGVPCTDDQPTTEGQSDERTPSPGSGSFLFADFGFGAALDGGSGGKDHVQQSQWGTNLMSMQGGADAERPLIMAYNFPAVVLTLGGAAWPRLRQAHSELCADTSSKVRQCLGASLHEIAKLIGPEATNSDLLPVLLRYLTTEVDGEVKAAALENVHVILAHLPKETAVRELSTLRDLWSTSFAYDWRLRESLASQVSSLADHFVLEDEEGSLMAIMQTALSDPVSAVRDAGVKAAPSLYKNFAEHDQTVADGVLGMLADMGESASYRVRVGFLLAAHALVESRIQRSSFQLIMLPRLLSLGSDAVVDVRIALAKVTRLMCTLDELFASPQSRSPELLELLRTLAVDSSPLVRSTIVDLFDAQDPILTATPQPAVPTRRDLVLGPAGGGPHKPAPSWNAGVWDANEGQQQSSEPFAMDEDQQDENDELQLSRQQEVNGEDEEDDDAGMVHMSEHDINSDLDMVDIEADSSMFDDGDDEEDAPYGTLSSYEMRTFSTHGQRGDGDGNNETASGDVADDVADDSFDSREEEPHHLMSIDNRREANNDDRPFTAVAPGGSGSYPLGFSMNGFGGEDLAQAGSTDPTIFSLTSPERIRGGMGAEAAADGHNRPQYTANGAPSRTGPPNTSPSSTACSTTGADVADVGRGDDDDDGGGASPPNSGWTSYSQVSTDSSSNSTAHSQGLTKPVDPFLSFVSGALSPAALRERGRDEKENGKAKVLVRGDAENETEGHAVGDVKATPR